MTKVQRLQLQKVFNCFKALPDPRLERCRCHSLFDLVVLALCATIGGCNSWVDVERFARGRREYFGKFLSLLGGIPSHDTFSRVFALLDTPQFTQCVRGWIGDLQAALVKGTANGDSETNLQQVAIDGKTLRGSRGAVIANQALQLVNAWSIENRLVLGQSAADPKSNELTAIPALIAGLDLKDKVVSIDAIYCQKNVLQQIVDKEADYVVSVKANQEKLHEQVLDTFEKLTENDFADKSCRRHVTTEHGGGEEVVREYVTVPANADIKSQWPDAKTVGMVVTKRRNLADGTETGGVRYYLSSLDVRVKRFASVVRHHWCIENQLHWSLDVTFAEDRSRIKKGNGPMNCAILRRLAVSILQQDTSIKDNLTGKRKRAGWDDDIMTQLITHFSGDF